MNYTAFHASRSIASGDVMSVVQAARKLLEETPAATIVIFDDNTGEILDLDLRGSESHVTEQASRYASPSQSEQDSSNGGDAEPRRPGRPRLGVVAREVTLLPRHWEWLGSQPGGASVALRRLVDAARAVSKDRDRIRKAQDATYRFLSVTAGNAPGFEQAIRALFAADKTGFADTLRRWPVDVRQYAERLAADAWGEQN